MGKEENGQVKLETVAEARLHRASKAILSVLVFILRALGNC